MNQTQRSSPDSDASTQPPSTYLDPDNLLSQQPTPPTLSNTLHHPPPLNFTSNLIQIQRKDPYPLPTPSPNNNSIQNVSPDIVQELTQLQESHEGPRRKERRVMNDEESGKEWECLTQMLENPESDIYRSGDLGREEVLKDGGLVSDGLKGGVGGGKVLKSLGGGGGDQGDVVRKVGCRALKDGGVQREVGTLRDDEEAGSNTRIVGSERENDAQVVGGLLRREGEGLVEKNVSDRVLRDVTASESDMPLTELNMVNTMKRAATKQKSPKKRKWLLSRPKKGKRKGRVAKGREPQNDEPVVVKNKGGRPRKNAGATRPTQDVRKNGTGRKPGRPRKIPIRPRYVGNSEEVAPRRKPGRPRKNAEITSNGNENRGGMRQNRRTGNAKFFTNGPQSYGDEPNRRVTRQFARINLTSIERGVEEMEPAGSVVMEEDAFSDTSQLGQKVGELEELELPNDVKSLMREVYALRSVIAKDCVKQPVNQKGEPMPVGLIDEMKPTNLLLRIKMWSESSDAPPRDLEPNEFFGSWPSEARYFHVQWANEIHKFLMKTHEDRESWMSMVLDEECNQLSIIIQGLLGVVKDAKEESFLDYQELLKYLQAMIHHILEMLDFRSDNVSWIQAMTHRIIQPLLREVRDASFQRVTTNICLDHVLRAIEHFSLPSVDLFAAGEAMEGAITIFDIIPNDANFEECLKPLFSKIRKHCALLMACINTKMNQKLGTS